MKAAVRLARRLVAFELSLYRSLFRWVTRRPDVPPGTSAISYVRGVYPHLNRGDGLRVRHGTGTDVLVPWDVIASVGVRERSLERSKAVQVETSEDRTVLSVVIASRTNVDLVLERPLAVPRPGGDVTVDEVRLFADDPRALAARVKASRRG